ncbi:hypothetical protein OAT67_01850 [Bacteriovoracaceae bacterium]|nr:hypothetical protein [Bacteriovoracaceae bacterium]
MNKIIMSLLVGLLIFGCATRPTTSKKNVLIRVEHKRKTDSWQVEISLPSKVKALVFNRQTNTFRRKNWKVNGQDLEIRHIDGKEYIVSKTEKEFNSVSLSHKSYYEYTPKDYEFFFKYSSGDVLMYSGHYDVVPIYNNFDFKKGIAEKDWPENGPLSEFILIPSKNEKIVILGNVYEKNEVNWTDIKGKGTYIYWGNNNPLDTKRLVVVVDKKVPKWLSLAVNKNLPTLFDFYNRKIGIPLNFKPVVYLSYEGEDEEGLSNTGGTLPGLIQLTLRGKDWKKNNSESFEYLYKFLAHESAHLWNGQMFNYSDGKHSWMHEGGADAFAYRALRELKIVNDERYLEYLNASLNKCILGLNGKYPLVESANNRAFKNYYYCGSTIGLITEKSLKEGSLFDFWRSLFKQAKSNNQKYSDKDYLKNFDDLAKSNTVSKNLNTLIYGPSSNTGELLREMFKNLGVEVGPLKKGQKNMSKRIARSLLSDLYRSDCDGSLNLTRKKESYLAHGDKSCKSFKKDFEVQKVGSYHIFKDAEKAYEFARTSCRKNKYVNLFGTNLKKMKVSCPKLSGPFSFFEILKI